MSLHIHAAPAIHDELLTREAALLLRELVNRQIIGQYHFVRFPDPRWHLRLRLRAAGAAAQTELHTHVAAWCGRLAADGRVGDIVCTTYRREVERYGGADGIELAEELFTLSSRMVLAILTAPRSSRPGRVPAAVLSLERIARPFIRDCAARRAFLPQSTAGAEEYRTSGPALWHAANRADAAGLWPADLERAWWTAAQDYSARLADRPDAWEVAIRGLVHMHCNRLGLSRHQEQAAYGVWRRLLDRCARDQVPHRMCPVGPAPEPTRSEAPEAVAALAGGIG